MDEVPRITPESVTSTIDQLFRRESGKVVSALVRQFGTAQVEFAEDIVQDVLVKALEIWPARGLPDRALHWMITTARNLAIDALRKKSFLLRHEEEIAEHFAYLNESPTFLAFDAARIEDDTLRMIFACSHPSLPRGSQIILILRLLFGFRTAQIAKAIGIEEAAAAKRLVRAIAQFRTGKLSLADPIDTELSDRIGSVLNALYLVFAIGANASSRDGSFDTTISNDSIYMLRLVRSHPLIDDPRIDALLALMYFRASGMANRQENIALAEEALLRSARGETISIYHIEAAIAAEYAREDLPDLAKIKELYDVLVLMTDDPRAHAARAAVLAKIRADNSKA